MRSLPLVLAVVVAGAGCPAEPPTYLGRTKQIFDAKCAGCHQAGGIGPFALTSYDEIAGLGDVVKAAIDNGTMPPWMPGDGCNEYANDFSLTDEEHALLDAWFAADMPVGEASSSQASALENDGNPLAPVMRYDELFDAAPEPYQPDSNDDYRCFAIAWPYEDERYITGFDMLPGDPTNVHHVNIFMNPPDDEVDFVQFDLEDPAPGFSCGRGDRIITSALVGAWAPGASGVLYPAGTGQLVEPGSSITLEVHYARGGAAAVPDASQLALQVDTTVERRALGAAFWAFNNWDNDGMPIPAGESAVTHEITMNPQLVLAAVAPWITSRFIDVHVVALHMHQLGANGRVIVRSPIGDSCLLEIPRWDFHWQAGYQLKEPVEMFLGEDELFLSCTWDNSADNQPVGADGEPQQPRDVNWGTRTTDEMCIGFLYLVPQQ